MPDQTWLPRQYRFLHEYCLFVHDYLTDFIVFGEDEDSFDVTMEFADNEEAQSFSGLEGEQIWEWLEDRGYSHELGELLLKSLFPALLSDFCQFLSEALSCSERARLTVAYSLLRKPLKENLAYFEWLLGDPETLLNTLYNDQPDSLAIHLLTQQHSLIPVMRQAVSRVIYPDFHDCEFIYKLRYDKTADFGLDRLWHKAVHLVTTHDAIATEPQNLNFIFSGHEARLTQWDFLYRRLPLLLHYTADICDSLFVLIHGELMPNGQERFLHRLFGWIACAPEISQLSSEVVGDEIDVEPDEAPVAFSCPHCGSSFEDDFDLARSMFEDGKARCSGCGEAMTISDFIEPNESGT